MGGGPSSLGKVLHGCDCHGKGGGFVTDGGLFLVTYLPYWYQGNLLVVQSQFYVCSVLRRQSQASQASTVHEEQEVLIPKYSPLTAVLVVKKPTKTIILTDKKNWGFRHVLGTPC